MIEIKLDNAMSEIKCTDEMMKRLRENCLSYMQENAEFVTRNNPFWDGRIYLCTKKGVFPSGLYMKLVTYLETEKIPFKATDVRKKEPKVHSFKINYPTGMIPRYYQNDCKILSDQQNRGVYVMGTGCLSGDTIVNLNRGGNSKKYKLSDAFKCWNGLTPRGGFNLKIKTHTRSYRGDKILKNLVKDIVQSGIKEVYNLKLKNGLSIKATDCHKFFTDKGFVALSSLSLNDKIMCDVHSKKPKNKLKKPRRDNYYQIQLKNHPYAGKATKKNHRGETVRMYRVALHRVIAEAQANMLELEDFILRIKNNKVKGLKFYDPKKWAVHHIDHNHKNNAPDNLKFLTHKDHAKKHGDFSRFSLGIPTFSQVKSIEFVGKEMTYDVVCDDPWRNFVANGMVVHNSGKTLTSAIVVENKQVDTLIIVPDTGLRTQMEADYAHWFGERNVGTKITESKPIIVTNIQALANKDKALFSRFKMLIIDEMHHSAAKTYRDVNSLCANAYYRYGFTGTFMRSDGSDMEMYGVLSNVIFTKTTSELIEEGFLVRPYITVTKIDVSEKSPTRPGTTRKLRLTYKDAYDFIIKNKLFNKTIAEIANRKIKEGKQTLVVVRRKEHGKLLSEMIEGSFYLDGDSDVAHRESVKKAFIAKKVRCLVATNIFGEGQDIPSIDVFINARAEKTEIQTAQGIGRALRKHGDKDKAEVFDFLIIGQRHLEDHSVERINSYRKQPAFRIQIKRI